MKLDGKALGLACGILVGACLFLATWFVYFAGGGDHMVLLRRFLPFYSVTPAGSILALVEGWIEGFLGGGILAFLYNRFAAAA
ncbi:MAG: hypothetical protein HY509_03590 [Acidobacteria bacterium]|nr:hypothetical protein [Acidobacteriota bacterium]